MFTCVAFYVAAGSAPTTLTEVAVLADQHVTYNGNDLMIPELNKVMAVLGISTDIERLQLDSPELRGIFLEEISPLVRAQVPTGPNGGICDMHRSPLGLKESETLNVLLENTAITYDAFILVWLTDGIPQETIGEIHTIRAVPATAPTAFTWTHSLLTLSQSLPAGRYALVGASWIDASGIAARFKVSGNSWRPACPANTIGQGDFYDLFRKGKLGNWLEFDHDSPPTVDLLSGSTTAGEIFLDLIKIG